MESFKEINLIDALKFSPQLTELIARLPWQKFHQLFWIFVFIIIGFFVLNFIIKLVFRWVRFLHHSHETFVVLEITPPHDAEISALSTSQFFSLILDLLENSSWKDKLILRQSSCAFEIVSQKESGIRYLLRISESMADLIEKNLRAYAPGIRIRQTPDYLHEEIADNKEIKVIEFKTTKHFSFPLNEQEDLKKHDPLAYLASNMTQLKAGDVLAFQIVARPLNSFDQWSIRQEIKKTNLTISHNRYVNQSKIQLITQTLVNLVESVVHVLLIPLLFLAEFITGLESKIVRSNNGLQPTDTDTETGNLIKSKISKPLYETSIRALLILDKAEMSSRTKGLCSSFTSFLHPCGQSLTTKKELSLELIKRYRFWQFKERLSGLPLYLSASELAALYHFTYSTNTQTEDLVRVGSKDLPTPLAIKNSSDLDVIFGQSTFGNSIIDIGLADDDRSRHVYLIGQTGSGKTTIIYHMAKDDIAKDRGLCVIDPHGDLAEDLLNIVPEDRIDDLIYFNPFDIKHPVGINLLELTPNLDEDDLELEKELVCESIVSIFRRVFFKDEKTDAHRIEYILRNTIYTAFIVKDCTIFTVYDLLNDANFRKSAVKNLTDENLVNFWKNEFGKAGDYQHVKMVGGVTSKIGRFLFSPIAKRILEQPKSTINFDDIMDHQKILICNLAEGKLGEDTSQLLGATIIAKIQQATVRRARQEYTKRKPFYLFVDEFQNFATSSFTKLLSGGRKFGLRITIAEQSTAQQSDRNIVNVILANTGTVICFRTASPVDEALMLSQFAPQVALGDIANLPRYNFYMKISANIPQDPFSGQTIPILAKKDLDKVNRLMEHSRNNYAVLYQKLNKPQPTQPKEKPQEKKKSRTDSIDSLT
ncbi:MAG: type IV secretion system DNA-binding domain-containing protein [Candidatus Berkelbacteria bacterium]